MILQEVKQNWPDDLIRIDITLGNICNYKCWYCWPGCNEGNHKWPNFDTFVSNLDYLMDYYLTNTNKKKFDFHIMGGEATHWPKFIEFIKYFKERYTCVFTLTTNASKKLSWFENAVPYLDYVNISVHPQFSNISHINAIADYIYEQNTIVIAMVLMDPTRWEQCISIIEELKTSRRSWAIRYLEIIHDSVNYTDDQKKILDKLRARRANLFWFFKNNKSWRSDVKVIDDKNKKHSFKDHELILNRLNNFEGWECNAGVDWIAVKANGDLSGICGNDLYDKKNEYNLFLDNFKDIFYPKIKPTICKQKNCWCMFETNMPKKKIL